MLVSYLLSGSVCADVDPTLYASFNTTLIQHYVVLIHNLWCFFLNQSTNWADKETECLISVSFFYVGC